MTLSRIIHEGTKVSNIDELTRFDPYTFLPIGSIPPNTLGVVEKLGILQTHDKTIIVVFSVLFDGYGVAVFNGSTIDKLTIIDNHEEGETW